MTSSLNRVSLIGSLDRKPDLKRFDDGTMMVVLRIATSESWNDKRSGERVERTEWHDAVVRGPLASEVADKWGAGDKVLLEGRLNTRSYTDRDGNKRYATQVVIDGLVGRAMLLGSSAADAANKVAGKAEQGPADDESSRWDF